MSIKPWREIAQPHPDVLEGTFKQSEFAADLSAVKNGRASPEYQDARKFFERTFITEGMRLLLTQVAQRLGGGGGEPVIQLQTAFGGGKTHTMLAVYHLATRDVPLGDLDGIPSLIDHAGVGEIPQARVAVLDGNSFSPGQPWKRGTLEVRTLWGDLAWQLGGEAAYASLRASDESGTSPGKEVLRTLLCDYGPCVVLVDELVAYMRQFEGGRQLSGGTYESNTSFIQALTEAVKLAPNAVLLASLPESELEAGGEFGRQVLRSLEKSFGRTQALWKPVGTEESFEIVRRRLFEPISDAPARDAVCRAFAELYRQEGSKVPSRTQEARYQQRLLQAYPIHPEVFDRLYEDWSTLESFQRTRGVLKLMAHVIHELWVTGDKSAMIVPSVLPLYRGKCRDELVYHLPQGWDAVLDADVDTKNGSNATAVELDQKEGRFGAVQAARRVARSILFGSAPASSSTKENTHRGVDRAHVLLACLQPGESSAVFDDALNRLADRLHYLNLSGDKTQPSTRFWFDTRANLRREMEDRRARFDNKGEVWPSIVEVLTQLTKTKGELFDRVHIFTPSGDVPDDVELRLVVLDPDHPFSKDDRKRAEQAVNAYVDRHGAKPRFRGNRLLFLAADTMALGRLYAATRAALAWGSIVTDIERHALNIDRLRENEARRELKTAQAVVQRAARDAYKWVLCPFLDAPTARDQIIDAYSANTGDTLLKEVERVCRDNELVIAKWSHKHLRTRLQSLYWKPDRPAVPALQVWEDMTKYLYLERLKDQTVFDAAVVQGAATKDYFGIAYGEKADGGYEGFQLGTPHVDVNDTLLLIEPTTAQAYADAVAEAEAKRKMPGVGTDEAGAEGGGDAGSGDGVPPKPPAGNGQVVDPPKPDQSPKRFIGSVDVPAETAKMKLVELVDEIVSVLTTDPDAQIHLTVEIQAELPNGIEENLRRAVSENAGQLGFKTKLWE